MLFVAEPVLGEEEREAVAEVIESGWITQGARVGAFERAFAERHGAEDAVAVSSCTAALHLALAALGVGPGDEVLIPSLTFVATANAVLYAGAEPVFVDIGGLDDPLISLDDAEAKLTPRTRAVVLMHYAGLMAPCSPWRRLAERHGLLLIEDAAHAVGVAGVGGYGDGAAFSFYGNKNMTTAEGGMVLMRSPEALDRVRQMRGHGMTSGAFQRLNARTPHYDVTMLGYNYRLDEIRAAIGLVQLQRLEAMQAQRAALSARYRALVGERPALTLPRAPLSLSADHLIPLILPEGVDRDEVAAALREAGVQTTIHYPPVHTLSFYRERCPGLSLPVSEAFFRRELTLPLHPRMAFSDVDHVIEALDRVLLATVCS